MRVLLVGNKGNMGRRYSAILKFLGHEVVGVDIPHRIDAFRWEWDHAIIATPTETHEEVLGAMVETILAGPVKKVGRHPRHVLVEKPMAKSADVVRSMYERAAHAGIKLYCVNQYAYLPEAGMFKGRDGIKSSWNYYNSGRDGLTWDCFQIFAQARGPVEIDNTSPMWRCTINGVWIDPRNMDGAYTAMIHDFLGDKLNTMDKETVLRVTERIQSLP